MDRILFTHPIMGTSLMPTRCSTQNLQNYRNSVRASNSCWQRKTTSLQCTKKSKIV